MKNWSELIYNELKKTLHPHVLNNDISRAIEYSTFPAGKLFRSNLIYAMAHDLKNFTQDHKVFASSIELHHTYTLIHDDLPAMDDDDERRGRASCHKKFNEWTAILAGDSLLNISFSTLSKISPDKLPWLLKFYGFCTGNKGLILGQCMDMQNSSNDSFETLLTVHTLKTSRLIQLCILGSAHLSMKIDLKTYKNLMQLGKNIGVIFQLLDDYQELSSPLGDHEKEVNPFLKYGHDKTEKYVKDLQFQSEDLCRKYDLNNILEIISNHFQKSAL